MLNIAHRGFSSKYPENTLIAFQKAIEAGADGIECDLRQTADGKLVLFHDDHLNKLCGVPGSVEEKNWSELKDLKVKSKERIAQLDELLDSLPSTSFINIEIKKTPEAASLAKKLETLLKAYSSREGSILISSFCEKTLRAAHQSLSKFERIEFAIIFDSWKSKDFLHLQESPWINYWNTKLECQLARPSSLLAETPFVFLWTLNQEIQWKEALRYPDEVKGVITDFPDRLANFLANHEEDESTIEA